MKLKKLMDSEKKPSKKAKSAPMMALDVPSTPHVYLNSEQIPEVKDWKMGGEYTIRVRQKSRTTSEHDGKTSVSGEFEVIGVGDEPKSTPKKSAKVSAPPSYAS